MSISPQPDITEEKFMKKAALCFGCISSILLFTTTLVHAAEKKIVFNAESIKYESGTGSERCLDKCSRRSGPDAKSLLSEGWKIVSSSPKKVIGEQYWYVPCNTCKPHGCICIGTEYILQKDEPALKIETISNVPDAPDKDNRTVLQPVNVETMENELERLKKEYELLKQENEALKQEIETIRNQMKREK
jgi:hypothetical protein